ncbi:DUF481 domain-containing protein [Xanthocytophaga flava]|uniref:DUF481 domain-containing protein n=1 Tax=Xanthocytophaga flava TaxID=3048013 RepID=UPI0028D13D51|nr:DUF481 domain-containing protein [Xanthocytophaga flavus]MDJ1471450.1 DUF481 domain-containing protein [Xanthocytophaga flavus]
MKFILILFLGISSAFTYSHAQIVDSTQYKIDSASIKKNTTIKKDTLKSDTIKRDTVKPPAKPTPPPPPSWTYVLGLDGMINSGNVNRKLLTLRLGLNHENPNSIWGFYSSPRFQYGTNNEVLQEREVFFDFNNTWFYSQHDVYGLLFGIYEQSNLRQINDRLNIGVGVGWRIIGGKRLPSSRVQVSISNAFLREATDFISSDTEDLNVLRNSTRFRFRVEIIREKLTLQSTIFFQPAINRKNLRWNSISQLVFKLNKHFSLTSTLDNSYESYNVAGVKSSQLNSTLGLSYTGSK